MVLLGVLLTQAVDPHVISPESYCCNSRALFTVGFLRDGCQEDVLFPVIFISFCFAFLSVYFTSCGSLQGFDLSLVNAVSNAVTIPVIASSGAGIPDHFTEVFDKTNAAAALAAGIFHRKEVEIGAVKKHMAMGGIPTRL